MSDAVKPFIVIGDGWSALGVVGFLACSGIPVQWVVGSGARVLHPLASMEWGPGIQVWNELAQKLGIEGGEFQSGVYIREFRNKAFREPQWAKAPTAENRLEVRNEVLWAPETRLIGVSETRWENLTPFEMEELFRTKLLGGDFPSISRIEGVPVTGFEVEDKRVVAVKLGSGEQLECTQVVYADRWGTLPGLEGLPKALAFLRKRDPMGVLQAKFTHNFPIGTGASGSSYFAPLFREPEKSIQRAVWGHFSSDAKLSVWTVCLSPQEIEDNQEIGRKLRRLKGTLDRIFEGSDLVPPGKDKFTTTIVEEQVRFEEEAFFADGAPVEDPLSVSSLSGLTILTDGYGPSRAFQQVGSWVRARLNPISTRTEETQNEESDKIVTVTAPAARDADLSS